MQHSTKVEYTQFVLGQMIASLERERNIKLFAIRTLQPVVTRKLGFIAKSNNELPLASKYFINFMVVYIEELP